MNSRPSKIYSAALTGLQAKIVEVEADVSVGLHSFQIVGLPDKSIEEARERISSALKNSGFQHPRAFGRRTVINLAPADVKKEGGMYDLPLALSFLLTSGQAEFSPQKYLFAGELGLDGHLRPIQGVLPLTILAKQKGFSFIVVPFANSREARLVRGITVVAPAILTELIAYLEEKNSKIRWSGNKFPRQNKNTLPKPEIDMSEVSGQQTAKQALEIAAAGGHNIIMEGPPGSGKTILAKAFAGILPRMSYEEMMEVTQIHSIAGNIDEKNPLVRARPFRAPHHSSSEPAIIGGGANLRPGEITLAHRGVLFLDEFPEFHRDVLESLRQPLESGKVSVARARGHVSYPAKFILVAAANPCPCGFANDPEKSCMCSGFQLQRYRKKFSGPIADRIDIHIQVPHQKYATLTSEAGGESSEKIKARVERAREIQRERFRGAKAASNSEMAIADIKKYCQIPESASAVLEKAVDKDHLSARGYHKVLKLARTIADLEGRKQISMDDVLAAIKYNRRD